MTTAGSRESAGREVGRGRAGLEKRGLKMPVAGQIKESKVQEWVKKAKRRKKLNSGCCSGAGQGVKKGEG